MRSILITTLALTGCLTDKVESDLPHTIYIPHNVASQKDWDGANESPVGKRSNNRVIDYNGHGLGYNGYHVDQFHRKYYKDNGISPH
jgi:hypothetical protein